MEKGTPHGFKNVGSTPAAVMEVFVKEGTATAAQVSGQRIGSGDARSLAQILAAIPEVGADRGSSVATQQ